MVYEAVEKLIIPKQKSKQDAWRWFIWVVVIINVYFCQSFSQSPNFSLKTEKHGTTYNYDFRDPHETFKSQF